MSESKVAAEANKQEYGEHKTANYSEGAPHLIHSKINSLYCKLTEDIYKKAIGLLPNPSLLDLGAGEGGVTLPFLKLGFTVTAVDSSVTQLNELKRKCNSFNAHLNVYCGDVFTMLNESTDKYDVVVMNSFIHHIPEYIKLIEGATKVLKEGGQIFTFQDPMRYDLLSSFNRIFSASVYFFWRIFQGDVVAGIGRKIRRARGIYYDDSVHDNAEYHVTRNGVDQEKIKIFLESAGFNCQIITYFSTQSRFFQMVGDLLGVKNTFAIVAYRY